MKAKLEFNLDEHFEKLAFKRASSADEAYLILWNLFNYLDFEKHNDVICKFNELLEKYNVNLDDLE